MAKVLSTRRDKVIVFAKILDYNNKRLFNYYTRGGGWHQSKIFLKETGKLLEALISLLEGLSTGHEAFITSLGTLLDTRATR